MISTPIVLLSWYKITLFFYLTFKKNSNLLLYLIIYTKSFYISEKVTIFAIEISVSPFKA